MLEVQKVDESIVVAGSTAFKFYPFMVLPEGYDLQIYEKREIKNSPSRTTTTTTPTTTQQPNQQRTTCTDKIVTPSPPSKSYQGRSKMEDITRLYYIMIYKEGSPVDPTKDRKFRDKLLSLFPDRRNISWWDWYFSSIEQVIQVVFKLMSNGDFENDFAIQKDLTQLKNYRDDYLRLG